MKHETNAEYSFKDLHFLGLLPCPVKIPFEEAFKDFASQYEAQTGLCLRYKIFGNANHHVSFADYLETASQAGDLPDILLAPGLNMFFSDHFKNTFLKTRLYTDASEFSNSPLNDDLQDPKKSCSIIAMNSLLMAVDKTALKNIPHRWDDLLSEEYEKKVAIRGDRGNYCETVLTSFYKTGGTDSVRKLARSVTAGMHPAEMVKMLNGGTQNNPAIYVMPNFYAKMIRSPNVLLIEPEEGALLNPVFLLVKSAKKEELSGLLRFLMSTETGHVFQNTEFLSVHSEALGKISEKQWLGWDFIHNHEMTSTIKYLNECFTV